jgi:uncharacterized protein
VQLDLDMRSVASNIRLADVLTIHGTLDRAIPFEDAKQWGNHIASHRLLPVEGADHSFLQPAHAAVMVQALVDHVCTGA